MPTPSGSWLTISLRSLILLLALASSACNSGTSIGLRVSDGHVLRRGTPYRGIGVNYFSAFYRVLKNPADSSYREGFAELGRYDVPFARIMACGFWPVDWKLYRENREAYFRLLDHVVDAARENRVGLIFSLFWHVSTVPDLMGEPVGAWGDPKSKTHAFMRQYVREIVNRYHDADTIWGWEFGNEMSLLVDLPNAAKNRPKVAPKLGTPASRNHLDELSSRMLATALGEFARSVRKYDAHRMITSGNSMPRDSAWHNTNQRSWSTDTHAQFQSVLLRDNPDPVDAISIHCYPDKRSAYFADGRVGVVDLLRAAREASAKNGQALFVGEFGVPVDFGDEKAVRAEFNELLKAIEQSDVDLAALWVYDHAGQDRRWNITAQNGRAWMLGAIRAANRRLQESR